MIVLYSLISDLFNVSFDASMKKKMIINDYFIISSTITSSAIKNNKQLCLNLPVPSSLLGPSVEIEIQFEVELKLDASCI